MAPLWLTIPTGPSAGSSSMNMVEKLAIAPVPKLARPCEFGPTTRKPRARARSAMDRSSLGLPDVQLRTEGGAPSTFEPPAVAKAVKRLYEAGLRDIAAVL